MGVNKEVINKYSVYSIETANEMSKTISKYTNANYSIGVTGQLKRKDPNNKTNEDKKIYISIYNKDNDTYHNKIIIADKLTRKSNKKKVVKTIIQMFNNIL